MNHHKKSQEQNRTTNGNNNVCEHMCGNFELSALYIWDSVVSDDHDDDDNTPVKQDYDLDNLYGREQHEIEEQTDTLSEDDDDDDDDDIEDMDTYDQILTDTMKTSRTSNRTTQSVEEEHALSQKLSQLSTSSNNHQGKSSSSSEKDFEKQVPNYLTKSNKSFENMLNSTLSMNAIKLNNLEAAAAYRQIAIFIHQMKYNEILYSLWIVYRKSGLGTLKIQDSQEPIGPQLWSAPVKSMVKVNIRSGIKEHDACLTYVQKRLLELETAMKQAQDNLQHQINRLPNYSSIVQQAIETFVEENLTGLRNKIEYKIQLVHYDYDERILELQYLQHNPTEAQIQLANQRCLTRQQHETTHHELQLLEKRIAQHNSSTPSFDTLSISRVPLFDSINNIEVRQQLNTHYKQMIEQSKMDMFKLYINTATTQMQYYQRLYNDEMTKMSQEQRSLPDDQKLSRVMVDLIVQRANIISERIKCTYRYKARTLSV